MNAERIESVSPARLLLRPSEAAEALGIGRSKLFELLGSGELESVLIGTSRRIPAQALSDFIGRLREKKQGEAGGSTA